jgi:Flp pilus assembly protein TadG
MILKLFNKTSACSRNRSGSATVEFAAMLAVIIPLLTLIVFAAIEIGQGYMIYSGLNDSAQRAARQLAINYGQNPSTAMSNYQSVYQSITFRNIVNSPQQFKPPIWQTTGNPPTVTVVCDYQSGQHGCPLFPNPDPLGLGKNFVLSAQAISRLE